MNPKRTVPPKLVINPPPPLPYPLQCQTNEGAPHVTREA